MSVMSKLLVIVLFCMVVRLTCFGSAAADPCELLSVVAIYRHGMRTPKGSYRNDPHRDPSLWRVGYDELTDEGKLLQYNLGKWLRTRYDGFLPKTYSKRDIRVEASDRDRVLMSAAANLAGLYPPQPTEMWHPHLEWHPIPVHTRQDTQDAILIQSKYCRKYEGLFKQLMHDPPYSKILKDNENVFKFVSDEAGEDIRTLRQMELLYGIVYAQSLFNVTLPAWAHNVTMEAMLELAQHSAVSFTFTPELARLKSGPLIGRIVTHFENIISNSTATPKFLMYAAHDSTLINLLNAMNIYNWKWPGFASILIFELRKSCDNGHFVNIIYKDGDVPTDMSLGACTFDCDFAKFTEILAPLRVGEEQWTMECLSRFPDKIDAADQRKYIFLNEIK